MAKSTRTPPTSRAGKFQAELVLHGKRADEAIPAIALYRLDGRGHPVAKVAEARAGKLEVNEKLGAEKAMLGIGPDVAELSDLQGVKLLPVRANAVIADWKKLGTIQIPGHLWPQWFFEEVCVSGVVRRCFSLPIPRPVLRPSVLRMRATLGPVARKLATPALSGSTAVASVAGSIGDIVSPAPLQPVFPQFCIPICDGVVEIWEHECCCDIVIPPDGPFPQDFCDRFPELCPPFVFDLCDRYPQLCEPLPELPPDFGPLPGPDPAPFEGLRLDRDVARAVKLRDATVDRAASTPLSPRLLADLRTLPSLPRAEAQAFVIARPWLHHLWCHCHPPHKVGEATLNADGSFSFCFLRPRISVHPFCTRTYAYKVRQWNENQWTEIYDGVAAHAWFTADETADLRVFNPDARTCGDPDEPDVDHGRPFVLLDRIGSTRTHALHSPKQSAEDGINTPLPANGGLVAKSWASDCPWATTLGFRLLFHEGMHALGAEYYRISLVESDDNGNPAGGATPLPFTAPRAWGKIEFLSGQYRVVSETLGPNVVGSEGGLYRIPYYSTGNTWLSGQYHQYWNTANKPNGRYLVLVEVFDGAGNRLKPDTAPGAEAGNATPFDFLYWDTADVFQTVDHAQLVHVLWADNLRPYGDIEDLRKNGNASTEECQFITGNATDNFSVGFRAFHRNGPPGTSFMLDWDLDWRRGLNGSWHNLDYGTFNVPPGLDAGDPQQSASASFATMLGGSEPSKCAFTVALEARAKHTNGHVRLESFDRWDFASFALEIL